MKLQSKLIAAGTLALMLSPLAAGAQTEVLIDGFDENQWLNEFGFGGNRNTDPPNGALMRYYPDVSNGGEGSMGFSILGLDEETGWAGVFPRHRDRNAFIGDDRDMRFRFATGSFDVRVDSNNGNRPFSFKFETNGNPADTPNGSAVIRPDELNEWFNISWEVNEGLTIEDAEYILFYYITRAGITINYDNAAGTPDDPGFTTGDFQVYFDNYMINGQPYDLFESKPRGLTHYASREHFFAYDQPWRSTTGIAVAHTEFANVSQYGPGIDPPFYLEFDDEFGEGNETGVEGFFALPETPSQGDRYLILTWSADADPDNEGADAEIVGISTNYYSEPVNLLDAESIKIDIYIPDWGQTSLPDSVILSLVDDNLIDQVQLGDAASATVNNPITAYDTWTTVTFPMESFVTVTGNAPDLSRIHHIEVALTGAGASGDTDTGRVVFDNLRYVEAEDEPPPPQEFVIDGFNAHQWFNEFGFGGNRDTDPPNGAVMRYYPGVSNGGEGSMGFSILGLDEETGWAGVFPKQRDRNAFIGDDRDMRFRYATGSFDVRVDSQNGNRPFSFKLETNGNPPDTPNGSAVIRPDEFNEWFNISWAVNDGLTMEDPEYIFNYYLTRAGVTINYDNAAGTPEDPGFTSGDFQVYFDNYVINGEPYDLFNERPRGLTHYASREHFFAYDQPWRSTTGIAVAHTEFANVFQYGPGVDPPFYLEFDDEFGEGNETGVEGFFALPESAAEGDRFMILTWSADADPDNEGADAEIVGISTNYYSDPVNLLGADELLIDIYIPDWGQNSLPDSVILSLVDDNLIDQVQLGDASSATAMNPITAFDTWTTVSFPIESFVTVTGNDPDLSRIHHIEVALTGAGASGDTDTGRVLFDNLRYAGVDVTPPPGLGDITGDGIVNVADVTALANLVAAGTPPPVEVGDINGDGVVDEDDVQALADAIANNEI